MTEIIKRWYSYFNAAKYEVRRRSGLKWAFEECSFNNLIGSISVDVHTVIDAPVGTGRFFDTYLEMPNRVTVTAADLSADMLAEARRKVTTDVVSFVQTDLLSDHLRSNADLVVCFRFLNLLDGEDFLLAIRNLLSLSRRYFITSIRLVNDDYTGEKKIENKIYLHNFSEFSEQFENAGFTIHSQFEFRDMRPGTYYVFLLERARIDLLRTHTTKSNA